MFWNTVLGEVWDGDVSANVTVDLLMKRREVYKDRNGVVLLPDKSCVITVGVDVQNDRLEALIKAYGPDNEQWIIDAFKIYGDPASDPPWAELTELLQVRMQHPSGRLLPVEAAAIDSGFLTQKVYAFSVRNIAVGRRWYAIKGMPGEGRPAWTQSELRLKGGGRLYLVGIDGLKTELYSRLGVEVPGANYVHFPLLDHFNEDWFGQLIVEKVRVVYDPRGHGKREFHKPPGARNEALDLNVYCDAAHKSLNIDHKARLARMWTKQVEHSTADIAKMFEKA